jgi:hypothetical protein
MCDVQVQATLTSWVFTFALAPFIVFAFAFWPLRGWRLRQVSDQHAVKVCHLLCFSAYAAVLGMSIVFTCDG